MESESVPTKPGVLDKCKKFISDNPTIILCVLIILVAVIIYFYVYYKGILSFGPYVMICTKEEESKNKKEVEDLILSLTKSTK